MGLDYTIVVENKDQYGKWKLTEGLYCHKHNTFFFNLVDVKSHYSEYPDCDLEISAYTPIRNSKLYQILMGDHFELYIQYKNQSLGSSELQTKIFDKSLVNDKYFDSDTNFSELYNFYLYNLDNIQECPFCYFEISDVDNFPWDDEVQFIGWVQQEKILLYQENLRKAMSHEYISFSPSTKAIKVIWSQTFREFVGN